MADESALSQTISSYRSNFCPPELYSLDSLTEDGERKWLFEYWTLKKGGEIKSGRSKFSIEKLMKELSLPRDSSTGSPGTRTISEWLNGRTRKPTAYKNLKFLPLLKKLDWSTSILSESVTSEDVSSHFDDNEDSTATQNLAAIPRKKLFGPLDRKHYIYVLVKNASGEMTREIWGRLIFYVGIGDKDRLGTHLRNDDSAPVHIEVQGMTEFWAERLWQRLTRIEALFLEKLLLSALRHRCGSHLWKSHDGPACANCLCNKHRGNSAADEFKKHQSDHPIAKLSEEDVLKSGYDLFMLITWNADQRDGSSHLQKPKIF